MVGDRDFPELNSLWKSSDEAPRERERFFGRSDDCAVLAPPRGRELEWPRPLLVAGVAGALGPTTFVDVSYLVSS